MNELARAGADAIVRVVNTQRPANIELSSVSITEEGPERGIVLVPHKCLGGFSLILSVTAGGADLAWTSVGEIKQHDDIDLGLWLRPTFPIDEVDQALVRELSRPIDLSWRQGIVGRWSLYATIRADGREKSLWITRLKRGAEHGFDTSGREQTTLMGPEQPTFRMPVPVNTWRKYTWGVDDAQRFLAMELSPGVDPSA